MNDITNRVYQILTEYNIKPDEVQNVLYSIGEEINRELYVSINTTPEVLYGFKDTIFYNFEHLINSDIKKGLTTLKYLGTVYPNLIYCFTESNYLNNVQPLLDELHTIKKLWNSDIYFASLYSKNSEQWENDINNPSSLLIYDGNTETPTDYGITMLSNKIVDKFGNRISSHDNLILCKIYKIEYYSTYTLLNSFFNQLLDKCETAVKLNKGLYINFNTYEY